MGGDQLSLGDVVKLKQPYRPATWLERQPTGWAGFEFGVVVELGPGNSLSLFLYDGAGQLLVTPALAPQALLVPTYYDCTLDDVVRYQTLAESGYFREGV